MSCHPPTYAKRNGKINPQSAICSRHTRRVKPERIESMKYFILGAGLALAGVAHAGHEFPFYPSFYPQEITVEALDARAAAQRLAKGTLHAYVGGEIAAPAEGAKTGSVTSLGGYVVATFDRRVPAFADRAARCAAARSMKGALGEGQIWHPYAVRSEERRVGKECRL